MKEVSKYLLGESDLPKPASLRVVGRKRKIEGEFVGPLPKWWFIRAIHIGARGSRFVLPVGVILWRQYHFRRQNPVRLTGAVLREFGLNRQIGRRSLEALEKAGLITTEKFNYRSPLITIVTKENRGS
jgi:hypothetical protein